MEFRAEFFNILNHAELNNPDANILNQSSTFGQILTTADCASFSWRYGLRFRMEASG